MVGRRWFSQSDRADNDEATSIRSRASSMRNIEASLDGPYSETSDGDEVSVLSAPAARLKQFFRKRTEDLFIELDEPHKVYSPGDGVRGRVILILKNETKTLFTRLHFQGQVRLGSGKQVSKASLFRQHLNLWGTKAIESRDSDQNTTISSARLDIDTQSQAGSTIRHETLSDQHNQEEIDSRGVSNGRWIPETMCAGRHVFEFEFTFPQHSLPSSVDFGRGSVSYFLRCDHQKPGSITSRGRSSFRKEISVLDTIDIGSLPPPRKRHVEPDIKFKRKEGASRVHAIVELARAGYLKGETITLNIALQHIKPIKNMSGTIATLYRLSRFDSKEVAPQSFRKDLSQVILPILVDPVTLDYKVSPRLRIPPDVFPTIKSAGPVSFRYFVEVVLDLNGRTTVWQAGPSLQAVEARTNSSFESSIHTVDTDAIKREKGTYCVVFEVIIGTKQSSAVQSRSAHASSSPHIYNSSPAERLVDSQQSLQSPIHTLQSRASAPSSELASEQGQYESQSSFPLSKAALQAMEAALTPSMPPESGDEPASVDSCLPDTCSVLGRSSNLNLTTNDQQQLPSEPFLVDQIDDLSTSAASPIVASVPSLELLEQLENGALPAYHNPNRQT